MSTHDYTEENRRRLVEYFHKGEKGGGGVGMLGLEVEHHVVSDDGTDISYEPRDGRVGVREVLEQLVSDYPQASYNAHRDMLGLVGVDGSVTLEPSAQLEISAAPYMRIADVARASYLRHARAGG